MPTDFTDRHPEVKTDRQLLEETRDGRGESFELVYRRHHAVVLAYLARRVGEPELAADLMAETFACLLTLVCNPQRPVPAVPIAWLLVTARNLLIDSRRRGAVSDRARRRLAMEPLVLDDRDLERIAEIAADTELLDELAARLAPDQFVALRARVFDERDYSEIAEEIGCSESVVRKRVSRALSILRRVMEAPNHA